MQHTCSALIIHCIDFRFGKAIKKYLEDECLLGDCDIAAAAGAAKNLLFSAQDTERIFMFKQIALSRNLHDIKKVILINHTDCGAYGGRKAFVSRDAERETHRKDMDKAAQIIKAKYPEIEVKTILADIEKDGSVKFI